MDNNRHILIVTALPFEGACIRRHLNLAPQSATLQSFSRSPYQLVISGTGKVRSAAAVGALCGNISPDSIDAVVNIGIAGAVNAQYPIGTPWLIHRIHDPSADKHFYPEMLAAHNLKETAVTTTDQIATDTTSLPSEGLVDMEASGFFEAASLFVGPEKIVCAKVVSDIIPENPAGNPHIDIPNLSIAIENVLSDIFEYIDRVCECSAQSRRVSLSEAHVRYMTIMSDVLQLTRTQQAQLKQSVMRFIQKNPTATLPEFIPARVMTTRERNQYFAQFQKALLR